MSKALLCYFQMKEWLEKIVNFLQHMKDSQHKFSSAVCVAGCLQLCDLNHTLKKYKFLFPLLNVLQLKPDVERKICPDYSYVSNNLADESFRYEIDNVYCTIIEVYYFLNYAHIVGELLEMQC